MTRSRIVSDGAGGGVSARRRGWRGPLAVLAALLAAGLLASACGVPLDSSAQTLSEPLPPALTRVTLPPPPIHTGTAHGVLGEFFYLQSSTLTEFPEAINKPATLGEVLVALETGPSISLAGQGVRSDLPVGSDLKPGARRAGGVATVELDPTYFELAQAEEVVELGQIVYTVLSTFPHLKAVQFEYNGSLVGVPNDRGKTVSGAVTESSYCMEAGGCKIPVRQVAS